MYLSSQVPGASPRSPGSWGMGPNGQACPPVEAGSKAVGWEESEAFRAKHWKFSVVFSQAHAWLIMNQMQLDLSRECVPEAIHRRPQELCGE